MGYRPGATAIVVLLASLMVAPALADDSAPSQGFQEVVISVSDLERATSFYREVAGWEVAYEGLAGGDQARFWGLEAAQEIREVLLRNPGEGRGFVRLVAFPDAERRRIRSAAQPWDTGGIFDVDVRVLDIRRTVEQVRDHGWQLQSEPIRFQFGPFVVREVLARGPDGVVLAMIQRVEPPLEGWPNLRQMSRVFNSTQVVRDFERSRDFYLETLGFGVYLEHDGPSPEPGPNVFGLPHNTAAEVPRRVAIVSPDGGNNGSVEILSFEGLSGTDFSDRAVPPNLGILALRFPAADLDALHRRVVANGTSPVAGPARVVIEPYGAVEVMAVQAPEGAWLEFFEPPPPADMSAVAREE